MPFILSKTKRMIFCALLVVAVTSSAFAANTWNGGGADNNWSTVGNWGGAAPVYGTIQFSGTARGTNILNGNFTSGGSANMNQVQWTNSTLAAWVMTNANTTVLSLFDNGGTQAKLENYLSAPVFINSPITFAANNASPPNPYGEINAINGDLWFQYGTLTVNGSSVNGIKMFSGGRNVVFSNTVSATGKWFGTTAVGVNATIGGTFSSADFYVMNSAVLNIASGGTMNFDSVKGIRLGGDFTTTGNQNQTLGGTLNFTVPAGGQTFSGLINTVSGNTSGALLINSLNTSGQNNLTGGLYLDSALRITNSAGGTLSLSGAGDLKAQTLTLSPSGSMVVGPLTSSLAAGGSLVVNGSGTVLLTNLSNSYTGTNSSSLNVNATQIGGGGALGIYADLSLGVAPAGAYTNIQFTGNGTLRDALNNITLNANRNISIASGAKATFDSSNNTFTVNGIINGSGSLTKIGTGTLTLTNANSYTGATIISGGVLSLNHASALGGGGDVTFSGGSLLYNANSAGLDISSRIKNSTSQITLRLNGQSVTHAGSIDSSSVAGFQVTGVTTGGGGMLTVTAANNYGGNTAIGNSSGAQDAASITVSGAGTLGSGTINIGPTGNLNSNLLALASGASLTNPITLGGRTTNNINIQNLSGISTLNGTVSLLGGGTFYLIQSDAGLLQLTGSSGGGIALSATATGNRTVTLQGGGDGLVSGSITNGNATLSLTKAGAGTWTLSGSNTYSGITTVSGGTLLVNGSLAAGNVTVSNSATLGGGSGKIGGNVTFSSGALATNSQGSPLTISGSLTVNSNTVNVRTASALGAGDYTLMTYNPAGSSGAFNSTPVISGAGLAANTTGVIVTGSGSVILRVTLNTVPTTLTLVSSANPSTYGNSVTFTASVQTNSVTAVGTKTNVIFRVDGTPVATNSLTSGQATYSTSLITTAAHTITATYLGDANYLPSTNTLSQSVNPAPLGIMANNAIKTFDGLPFTGGNGATFTGFVNTETSAVLGGTLAYAGTSQGAINAGTYTIVPSGLTSTNYSINYTNGGLTINAANPTLNLASSLTPAGYLANVAFTATLPSNATGNVIFSTTNGPISTNALSAGVANSAAISSLPRGTNLITAIYSGDANFFGSTNSLAQVVTNHPPVAALASYFRGIVPTWKIKITDLVTNVSDVDGDLIMVTSAGPSTNGATFTIANGFVFYNNANLVNDQFTYLANDSFGGTTNGVVNLIAQAFVTGQNSTVTVSGSTATVSFAGIPAYSYTVQRSTNVVDWAAILTTNAPSGGLFQIIDDFSDLGVVPGSAYYRLRYNP